MLFTFYLHKVLEKVVIKKETEGAKKKKKRFVWILRYLDAYEANRLEHPINNVVVVSH